MNPIVRMVPPGKGTSRERLRSSRSELSAEARARTVSVLPAILSLMLIAACGERPPEVPRGPAADRHGFTAPTEQTIRALSQAGRGLPLDDRTDFEDARRGFIAGSDRVVIRDETGRVVWDTGQYAFLAGDAPDSVHPALWRQAQLNNIHGLFRVEDGIYQVRGYDLSNMTVIEGASGWIVVDPLTSAETSRAAFELVLRHLGRRPIRAVIFTHSHIDHFGGVSGILPAEGRPSDLRVIVPRGFLAEATSENILAGLGMNRRAMFMFGMPLPRSPRGHVDSGLGKAPAVGTVGILEPTDVVDETTGELEVDGVRFVFFDAAQTEAPAELMFYLPDRAALCAAEVVTHTMHNLYTLRGAQVRDALRWSEVIDETLERFGDAEVMFASHHWPVWGNARVRALLAAHRDVYRYIHDQTLRLANNGLTPSEIAEAIELPASLQRVLGARGYYGTVRHNARAVYQRYFGWYDGNPAHLDPLPPEEAGKRYVEAMGGPAAVLQRAQDAFDRGEYRWAAQILDHLVFAEPGNGEARALLARVYDQLGYQAESGPWRDEYLTAAYELRHGTSPAGLDLARAQDLLAHAPVERFLQALAARIDGTRAAETHVVLNLVVTDLDQSFVLWLENGVLHHRRRDPDPEAAATIRLTRRMLVRLFTRQAGIRDIVFSPELDVDGSRLAILSLLRLLDPPKPGFAIVTP